MHRLRAGSTWRGGWPALAALLLISLAFRIPAGGGVAPAHGDVPAYLAGAYHLHTDQVFTNSPNVAPTSALGREPLYSVFLAAIMALDPAFGRFTPACLAAGNACSPATYRTPSLANLGLILATGIVMFLLGRQLCGSPIGGLVASAYLLLNTHLNKGWADLMSDRLAVFLVACFMLALAGAWRRSNAWSLAPAAFIFAALTLTKAIFLPFGLAAWSAAALLAFARRGTPDPRGRAALMAAAAVFSLLVGGWTARNWAVSGMVRLTDARSGIALSTRAVFDDMSPRDYAASLVYWTGSFGPKLAARWFDPATAARFDFDQPGGYYDIGQNGYPARVADIMQAGHLDYWQATAEVDRQIEAAIRHDWPAYLATMLPLAYRGLWVDEFMVLGVPCLIWMSLRALRRRDTLLATLLGLGVFNILAYAALSLNIQRYQMTAMPAVALAVAVACAGRDLVKRRK